MAKKPKGSRHRYALKKSGVQAIHREYHDFDYLDKLSEEELDWMAEFIDAELQSNTDCPGASECPPEEHEEHLRIYRDSNRRRSCLHGVAKAGFVIVRRYHRHDPDEYVYVPLRAESLDELVDLDGKGAILRHELVGNRVHGLEEDLMIACLDAGKEQPD